MSAHGNPYTGSVEESWSSIRCSGCTPLDKSSQVHAGLPALGGCSLFVGTGRSLLVTEIDMSMLSV